MGLIIYLMMYGDAVEPMMTSRRQRLARKTEPRKEAPVGGSVIEVWPMRHPETGRDVIRLWCVDRNGDECCVYAEPYTDGNGPKLYELDLVAVRQDHVRRRQAQRAQDRQLVWAANGLRPFKGAVGIGQREEQRAPLGRPPRGESHRCLVREADRRSDARPAARS